MMNNDKQPLIEPPVGAPGIRPYPTPEDIEASVKRLSALHTHHFTYQLNANHTALRGCACGLAFVGLMAGPNADALVWHQVHEVEG